MRTPLDLLDHEFIFSQQPLLRINQEEHELQRREVNMHAVHLEALHEVGILVHVFRLRQDVRGLATALQAAWDPPLPDEAVAG